MRPNPEVISQSPESEIDKNIFKVILLAVLGIGLSLSLFYVFNAYLLTVAPLFFWLTVVLGLLFLAIFILQVFLIKSRAKLNFIIALEALVVLGVFYDRLWPNPVWWLPLGALVFFAFFSTAAMRGSYSLGNSMKVHFWSTARQILGVAVTGLLVFMAIVLYSNYFLWGNFSDAMGQGLVNGALASANPILALQFPQTSFNDSVHDFLTHLATAELKDARFNALEQPAGGLTQNFNSLPPTVKQDLINQAVAGLKVRAEKAVGPLNDNAKVNTVVYDLIKSYLAKFSPATISILSLAAVVLFFFALRGLAALFYWLVILIAYIIFKFFIIVGFAYMNLETRSREFVMLS